MKKKNFSPFHLLLERDSCSIQEENSVTMQFPAKEPAQKTLRKLFGTKKLTEHAKLHISKLFACTDELFMTNNVIKHSKTILARRCHHRIQRKQYLYETAAARPSRICTPERFETFLLASLLSFPLSLVHYLFFLPQCNKKGSLFRFPFSEG